MPHVENIAKTSDIHSGRAAIMQAGSLPSTTDTREARQSQTGNCGAMGWGMSLGLVRPAGVP